MDFDNTLVVPLPPAEAWKVLLDIERVARCIPGAELTQVIDDRAYKGKVAVRLGPIALSLNGQAKFEEIDQAGRRARLRAQGADAKGRGSSDSTIEFRLEPDGAGTRVLIHSDVKLSGSIAQYGRGSGMIQSFAAQIIDQFGANLRAELAQSGSSAAQPQAPQDVVAHAGTTPSVATEPAPPARPISGLTLIAKSLWQAVLRRFKREPSRP